MTPELATMKHIEDAIVWMAKRDIGPILPDMFSPVGYVVDGIAGLWLYLTGSSLAYLEFLVTNPDVAPVSRGVAQDMVIEACLEHAKKEGCRTVMAPIARHDVLERALAHGFVVVARADLAARPLGGV